MIFNGSIRGDKEGKFTFTGGRGCTVIDYVVGEGEVRERIEGLRVRDKIDSNHNSMEMLFLLVQV